MVREGGTGGGIEEAPNDGQQYALKTKGVSSKVAKNNDGDIINYSGASAWGIISGATGNISAGLNCSKRTEIACRLVHVVTFDTPMPSNALQ